MNETPEVFSSQKSLQDQFAPHNQCFGCGPANQKGLQLKSYVQGNEVIAHWHAQAHHEAFPGMVNGGIIGALLDCHSNWTAAYFLMRDQQLTTPPCTVTANYHVNLKKPTPSNQPLRLVAQLKELKVDRATIQAQLYANDQLCATCEGLFVAVKPGHPAYHRW